MGISGDLVVMYLKIGVSFFLTDESSCSMHRNAICIWWVYPLVI